MLLEELRDALAALPSYAPVEVRDQSGSRAAIGAVDYAGGVIRVSVDDVRLTSDDDDDDDDEHEDEDADLGADDVVYLSTFRHRARMFGDGCGFGYPLCCVLFFVLVWTPVVRSIPPPLAPPASGVRGRMHTIARRLRSFWVPRPVEHVPCPWHRWRASRRSAVPDGDATDHQVTREAAP